MGRLVDREVRRLELRATCFRILASHTQDAVRRARLIEWAEEEKRNIAEARSPSDPFGESYRETS